MKKTIKIIAGIAIVLAGIFTWYTGHVPDAEAQSLGGGESTVNTLDAWKATTSPNGITQRVQNKPIVITGLATGQCLTLTSQGVLTTTTCGSGGGGGSATTTINGISGPTFLFATGTAAGIGLNVTGAGSTITFTPTILANYMIPLAASSTQWAQAFASTTALTPAYTRGLFSNTTPGLTFNNLTGVTSLTGGYVIPLSASTTDWTSFFNTPSTRIGDGTGLTWSANTLNCDTASGSIQGCLTAADWTTFNGKQAAGNYITALTGDVTASGPGSVAATLATVNGNVGSFGSSTAIPNFTVNAKGLITAAGTNVVIAPAGTLTGTTLASNVLTSSLTSVGTIGTGVWQGTAIGTAFGGTGTTTSPTPGQVLLGNASGGYNLVSTSSLGISGGAALTGTTGQVAYFSGTNTVVGTSTLFLTNGNVGIGTTTPAGTLSVIGNIFMQSTPSAGFSIRNSSSTFTNSIQVGNAGNPNFYANTDLVTGLQSDVSKPTWGLRLLVNSDAFDILRGAPGYVGSIPTIARFTSTGSLGLGELVPGSKLSVSGNATIGSTYSTIAAPTNGLLVEGNVGIGTSSPVFKLDIYDNNAGVTGFSVTNPNAGASAQIQNQLKNNSGSLAYYGISSSNFTGFAPLNGGQAFFGSNAVPTSIFTQDAQPIIFSTNATERMRLLANGNFGIGTTSPVSLLAVAGTTTATCFQISGQSTCLTSGGGGSGNSAFTIGNGFIYNATSSDNVGIGTTTPSKPLHVYGSTAGGVMKIERWNAATNAPLGTQIIKALSTGDMADGFGASQLFAIQDNAGVENNIADVTAVRSGADNTGALLLRPYTAGSASWPGLTLNGSTLAASIGTTSSGSTLWVYGDATQPTRDLFRVSSSTGTALLNMLANGNIGVGTTSPSSQIQITSILGATANATSGLALVNDAIATVGAQKVSPSLRFKGSGWKTTATAAAQDVEMLQYMLPVQGAPAPTGGLVFASRINNGAVTNLWTMDSTTGYLASSVAGGSVSFAAAGGLRFAGGQTILQSGSGGPITYTGAHLFTGTLGAAEINGRDEFDEGNGGSTILRGGSAYSLPPSSPTVTGGSVILRPGLASGSGTNINGDIVFQNASAAAIGIFKSAGQFGIASTTPGSMLVVKGTTTAPTIPVFTVASSSNDVFLTVLANGNIGAGTTTPTAKFSVDGVANGATGFAISGVGALQTSVLSNASGYSANTYHVNGTQYAIFGAMGSTALVPGGTLGDTFIRANAAGTAIRLSSNVGASSTLAMLPNQNSGFGTSTPVGRLSVDGTVFFANLTTSGTGNGVCISSSAQLLNAGGAGCTPSALRFKENVLTLKEGEALEILSKLRSVEFDYKERLPYETNHSYGVIAEEVEKIDKNLVDYKDNGEVYGVHFEKITGLLVQAVNELAENQGLAKAKRSVELNWVWITFGIFALVLVRQQLQIKKLTKSTWKK